MGNISVEFIRTVLITWGRARAQPATALIAIAAAHVILVSAFTAARRQFTARHGNKRSVGTFDDLQIAYHKRIVESNRTESSQSVFRFFHKLDANFSDLHFRSSSMFQASPRANICVHRLTLPFDRRRRPTLCNISCQRQSRSDDRRTTSRGRLRSKQTDPGRSAPR